MSYSLYRSALCLQDKTLYKGWSFFNLSTYTGEIVFNTSMTGYQEILSDPSYSGQMVVFTYPEIGNTGLNKQDNESNFIHAKAIIARNISNLSSSWRSEISLKDYIYKKRIPHIFGIDTRSLTKHLRSCGVMSASLSNCNNSNEASMIYPVELNSLDLIRKITTNSTYLVKYMDYMSIYTNIVFPSYCKFPIITNSIKRYRIVVLDFGLKFNILRHLLSLGCHVDVLPGTSNYFTIKKYRPDGILLSNGPGDPSLFKYVINTIRKIVHFSNVPIFGICMGHQILNLSCNSNSSKLTFGHRGANHPVGFANYSELTSQNHGFVIDSNSNSFKNINLTQEAKYLNLNDFTVAATFNNVYPFFSVQYHPESNPGPHDSEYLFKTFIELMNIIK
uniref:Carbamoyl phosphate synthase small chain n=1 Tax=Polysiphonia sertularioides TaxID=945028 RepID=A0A1Z1M928_9FLOR|nr:carbamoyl phosphate synthase small subunit [Polysiphonia sertularioides]ARW62402.1 carbamoyl phosphate synthase small subunit [Polysiphonia sertularioides]